MKLPLRLEALRDFYAGQSDVWDIGCDHGLLGLSFAQQASVQQIYLVDPAEAVVNRLHQKVGAYITSALKISVLHQSGQTTKLSGVSNCIFIAGMGGAEIIQIVERLHPQMRPQDSLVISPQNHILQTRECLRSLGLGLWQEKLILDRNRFYQILALKRDGALAPPSLYGTFWEGSLGRSYRAHLLKHLACHQDLATREFLAWLRGKLDLG